MRPINNQFSAGIASLVSQPSHEFEALGTGLQNFGKGVDNQERKEKEREKFDFEKQVALKEDAKKDLDFTVKYDRIKEKVGDNHKLASFLSSGKSFEEFTEENGTFSTPTATKTAIDFADKKKSMLNADERKKQWAYLSSNPAYMTDGVFDYGKATEAMSKKIRRGEVDSVVGAKLLDGLHKVGGYGVYANTPTNVKTESTNPTQNDKLLNSGKAALLKKALKIQDPKKQQEAISSIDSVSSMEELGALGAMVQESGTEASFSVDKKKASQKYAVSVGQFLSTSKRLDALIDDYNPEFTGMLDTAQENALQGTDLADPNYTAYQKNMGNVFLDFKELNNMGASFTESEQKMMRNAMPNLNSSDAEYQRDLVEFTKLIRDKVKSKIISLDSANYATGELSKVTDYYDNLVKRAETKFNKNSQSPEPTTESSSKKVNSGSRKLL